MNTYDYYYIPSRLGFLLVALSVLLIGTMFVHFQGVFSANVFKCLLACQVLLGCVGVDIVKNEIKGRRRRERIAAEHALFVEHEKRWG